LDDLVWKGHFSIRQLYLSKGPPSSLNQLKVLSLYRHCFKFICCQLSK